MIPKIFHQVWLGNDAIPENYKSFTNKWLELNPWWSYRKWDSINIINLQFFSKEDYCLLKNYAEKTDYLRFCILLEYGGVYMDMDFEPLKSIDALIAKYNFFIWERPEWGVEIAILWSTSWHEQLKTIFNHLHERIVSTVNYSRYMSADRIGPSWVSVFFKNKTIDTIFWDDCIIFNKKYFYPVHWKYMNRAPNNSYLQKVVFRETYGIHHYNSHWQSSFFHLKRYVYNIPYLGIVFAYIRRIFKKYSSITTR